jgi:HD-GYP domain-containing protein (c-di-GMP phosphodiesterase class II)/HAMP domain-containing protein
MKFGTKIFRSKIAHRIFFLFVSCALFPILCISIISFIRVTDQLNDQSYRLLKQSVTGYAYSVYERLVFLDTELQLMASSLKGSLNDAGHIHPVVLNKQIKPHFKAVAFFKPEQKYLPIYKVINNFEMPDKNEVQHIIRTGKTAIFLAKHPGSGALTQIIMLKMMDKNNPNAGYLAGEINPGYLWGIDQGNSLPMATDVCVLDESKHVIFSSLSQSDPFLNKDNFKDKNSISGQFQFVYENEKRLASYRKIFLNHRYLADVWTIVLSESKADVLAPMSHFKTIFPPVVLMSLWVVMLLSIYAIRKSLIPLELLKEGTQQIAMRNFDCRVSVKSGDEFEELAMDFNEMADQLDRQFKTLNTMSEIDRAILSSLDTKIIVKNVIHRIYDWFICDSVAVCLIDSGQKKAGVMYFSFYSQRDNVFEESFEFSPSDLDALYAHPEYLIVDKDKNRLFLPSPLVEQGGETFLILPVLLKETLKAVIAIGRPQTKVISIEDITRVRRTADQVAVALSNATLLDDLDQLNWGTIKALARTVDAKSSWTAGHSIRVTDMALKIGAAMKLPPDKLDDLHRAALLHDIGKVGVPVSILDKPGALDDDEYALIKKHPAIGARILEPIAAYKDILPMVLQHHERYDGKGYPAGISGDEIDIGARILAVADTFDAVRSDRPYRKGWELERVIDLITKEAGHQFHPDVVEAFLEFMRPVNKTTASPAQCNMA